MALLGDRTSGAGPGTGSLRTPFVTLRFFDFEIPLIDAAATAKDDPSKPIVPTALLLDSMTYSLSSRIGYGNRIEINIIDPNWDYIERLTSEAAGEGNRKQFSVSFGWRGIDDNRQGKLGISFFLDNISVGLTDPFAGARVTLRGIDQGIKLSNSPKSRSFQPNMYISDVIKTAIEEADNLLEVEIDPINIPVGVEHCRMENMNTMTYVQSLLEVAKDTTGGNTFSWIVLPSSIHGKTKIRIISSRHTVNDGRVRLYKYGREARGEMLSYTPRMEGAVMLALGGGRAEGIGVDPRTKTIVQTTSVQNEDPKLEEKRVHATPKEPSKIHELPFQSLDKIDGFVKGQRSKIDYVGYTADAVLLGDPTILPLDHIQILVLKTTPGGRIGKLTTDSIYKFASGIFRVDTVEHTISAGDFRTRLTLYKNSGAVGEGDEGQFVRTDFRGPKIDDVGDVIIDVQPLRND